MVKKILLLIVLCGYGINLMAQSVEDLEKKAQQLLKVRKEAEALNQYKEILKLKPTYQSALVAASMLSARDGDRKSEKDDRIQYYTAARDYAQTALQQNSSDAQANFALAFALSKLSAELGTKEKVAAYRDMKKYVDLALKFDTAYAEAYHLLGKWNYMLVNMNRVEKAAAKVLFGGVPNAGVEAAIVNYRKCLQLKPSYIINYYDLGIALRSIGQETEAMEILGKATGLRPIYQEDVQIRVNCRKVLDEMQ
ncbi:hypothetical protein COR50_12260 [Chitinophaga caeni]|uniref:Regulator of microtubule dynamics protein 1 n=1 Tax=Chitinophaga caeni TaxID=2029983 RepID=A0A291QVJ1_9BACT|nr:hypothetical protein [Chitinophaga caeni]ATL47874.1 hypothetical protein COR50_12260 [Chitinophaga caeni]